MLLKFLLEKKKFIILTYIGGAVFLFGSTSAMIIEPHYSFTNQWLSDLGSGRYGFLFNSTLVMTALLTSSFYPVTFYLLRSKGYSRIKSTLGMVLGVSSFIFLTMIGIFNIDHNIYNFHAISVVFFLISTSLAQILLLSGFSWYFYMHLASTSNMDSKLSYISLIVSIIFGTMFVGGITFQQFILQKITIYLLLITVLYQGLKISQSEELYKSTN